MPLVRGLYAPNAPNLIDPSVFGGAGASTVDALRKLDLTPSGGVDAIVVVTPHWVSDSEFLVYGGPSPRQLFDFHGFPPSLSSVRYRPPGSPELARRLVDEGQRSGVRVRLTEEWGLDHGAWAPLLHLAPDAKTPVVPLSVRPGPAADALRWGEAVGRAGAGFGANVAVVGTGSILHRLDRFGRVPNTVWEEGERAEAEVARLAVNGEIEALLRMDRRTWSLLAPEGDLAPLWVVLGAVGRGARGRIVHTDQVFGAAGLTILEFRPAE